MSKLASGFVVLALPITFALACASNDIHVGDDVIAADSGPVLLSDAGPVVVDSGPLPRDGSRDSAAKVDCVGAGGQCVGLVPGNCKAPNFVGDATQYSCGGGVGVMCCLPDSARPTAESCEATCEGKFPHDFGIYLCVFSACDACKTECATARACKQGQGDAVHAANITATCAACLEPNLPTSCSTNQNDTDYINCYRTCRGK